MISVYVLAEHFTDEQTAGPFEHWRHDHHFEADGRGGTVMRDVIDFGAPFGPLGTIAEIVALHLYMTRLIQARNQHLKAATESASVAGAP